MIHKKFEWDKNKATRNKKKHKVSFNEACTIFDDPLFITFYDKEHSIYEERYISIGISNLKRMLLVAHTDDRGHYRIISARKATRSERMFYEEGI